MELARVELFTPRAAILTSEKRIKEKEKASLISII
jgi:hypothetical protein